MLNRREVLAGVTASLAAPLATANVQLPEPLRIVMPFAAGGALDGMARLFAETYRQKTGHNCIVENKPGASTTIGAAEVSRSKPDGSVLLWTTGGHLTSGVLMKKLPYHPIGGFTPLTMVYTTDGFALLHRANGPFNSVADVIAAAKKDPGKISYASAGNGNTTHVVGALFAKSAGIELIHVPYKNAPFADLISGAVDITFIATSSVLQYIESQRLRALAITGTRRAEALPEVPTLAELGIPGVDVPVWIGLLAPPKMPSSVLGALYKRVGTTLSDPSFQAKMLGFGNKVSGMPSKQFGAYLANEMARYQRMLPPLGIEMDS